MSKIKTALLLVGFGLGFMLVAPATFGSTDVLAQTGNEGQSGGGGGASEVLKGAQSAQTGSSSTDSIPDLVKTIVDIMLFLLGAIAVLMIILGGFKYTTSNGDAEKIKSAKNTIMYSVIGLVVAILAYAIVDFVITSLL